MSFYAREIEFCASDESGAYVALIAIAKKKGGKPIKFVLYRFLSIGPKGMFESIEFSGSQEKEATKAFPYGPVVYRPIKEELEGLQGLMEEGKLPRTRVSQWKMTTDWLSNVAVGGSRYPRGTWVTLRKRPYTWRKSGPRKERKLRLKFGELRHILLKLKMDKKEAELDLSVLGYEESPDELDKIGKEIDCLIAEMKYVRDKKFPPAVSP